MPFNLLDSPFFPVLTRRGRRVWLPFSEIAASGDDEPLDFDWPRADFNIAALEFAVGVATLAFRPLKPTDWERLWDNPPGPEATCNAIAPLIPAFALDGDGPRFMQEFGGLEGRTWPIEALLIDTPGENGQVKNADVLTHRDRYPALGLAAAAMALYTLQQYAPEGGPGFRTSVRGGGPLTTLVLPPGRNGDRPPLWRIILANIVDNPENEIDEADFPKILPWLIPTLISDKEHGGRLLSQADAAVHPLQALFGMPRRVALHFGGDGLCAMTGNAGPITISFDQRPSGVNYGLWKHSLTPYRRKKEGDDPYSVKPKSARFGYRDWTPVVVGEKQGALAMPARAIQLARGSRRTLFREMDGAQASVRAAGWAMSTDTPVASLSAEQPLHLADSEEAQIALDLAAKRFAGSGEAAAAMLVQALKAALFSEGAKPATDRAVFEEARVAFYEASEDVFHDLLNAMLEAPEAEGEASSRKWQHALSRAAFSAFDAGAPIPLDDPERAGRIARAFRNLGGGLSGFGKPGQALFQILELPLPEASAAKKGKRDGK